MTYYIQAILLTWIEALGCGIFCETFLKKRRMMEGRIRYLFPPLLFAGFMWISLQQDMSYFLKAVFATVWIVLTAVMQYKNSLLKIFFVGAGYYGLVLCIDRIMILLIDRVSEAGADKVFREPVRGTLTALLCKAVLFLVIVLLNRKFRAFGSLNLIADREWLRFLLFPVITIACMTVFAMEGGESRAVLTAAFALVFSNFLMFYIIRDVVEKEEKIREMQIFRERVRNQTEMYRYMERSYEEQRKKVHEFKNQIRCLDGLLKSGNYKEMEKYVGKLSNSWVEETDCINTNHAIVNSILNQKYKQAKSLGIPVLLSVNDLSGLPVEDEDIVILLANLMDNAIEACQRLMDKEGIIKFRFLKEKGKIIISIRNPVQNPVKIEDGRPETTKANPGEHGIGMANIQSVADKYGGENIWSCREGYFTQSIIFHDDAKKV